MHRRIVSRLVAAAAAAAVIAGGVVPASADAPRGTAIRVDGINTAPAMRGWLSSAAAPDSWYDPANGLSLLQKDLIKLNDLQINHVRVEIPWALIEKNGKGQYDWSRVDSILTAMRDNGITVQAVLAFTPTWAQSGSKLPETTRYTTDRTGYAWAAVPATADYRDFVTASAQRFNTRYPGLVDQIEVWNEPDLYYWQGSPAQYSDVLLEPAYTAIKAVNPAFQVVLGPSSANIGWLNGVKNAGGLNSFDVLAHHYYGGVSGLAGTHDAVRSWMVNNGIASRPLQLDEYGGGVGVDGALITTALTSSSLTYSRVQLYNLRDDNDVYYDGTISYAGAWGIVKRDGINNKREYDTYKDLTAPSTVKTLVNDNTVGTGINQFGYTGTWNYASTDTGAYQSDTHWTNTAGAAYQVTFRGTQVEVYGTKGTGNGFLGISVDGGTETVVDTYATTRQDQVLLYSSPGLGNSQHTVKVRITGQKNAAATNTYAQADKVKVRQAVTVLNNATTGTGTNQFAYTGTWNYSSTDASAFRGDTHWTNSTNAAYQVSFSGTGANVYATRGDGNGIMAVSVDGGAETFVDTYATTRQDQILLYSTPTLSNGPHTVRVRVTGQKNSSSTNTYVQADKVVVR